MKKGKRVDILFYPEDRGGRFLQNIGNDLPDSTLHPRK
jgi:hypothetical protein